MLTIESLTEKKQALSQHRDQIVANVRAMDQQREQAVAQCHGIDGALQLLDELIGAADPVKAPEVIDA